MTTDAIQMPRTGKPTVSPTDRITSFLHAAAALFASHDSDIARQICRALTVPQTAPPTLPPATRPACDALASFLRAPKDDLTRLLAACAADLHWRAAGFGKLPHEADQKLTVAELVGPAGMFRMEEVRFGLLIQREGFHYPRHWHAAEELYHVVAGEALWAVDDDQPTPRAPGGFVHHRSMQPHRMITNDEPLLTLWGWTGDIAGASYAV